MRRAVLLPWLLVLMIDGPWQVETPLRFATETACVQQGESLALRILVDLKLTGHTVDPKCLWRP
jgi:hypothetical protein